VRDSGARIAITNTSHGTRLRQLTPDVEVLQISRDLTSRTQAGFIPSEKVSSDDLICILYTSGSTGQPKGVEIRHRSVARLLYSAECRSFGDRESILHMGAENFDISLLEVWGPLVHGGQCIIYPDRQPNIAVLQNLCKEHSITTAWFTTSIFNWLVSDSPDFLQALKVVYVGGEALSVPHIRRAQRLFPSLQIINGYGPTEGTTFTCVHSVPSNLPDDLPSIPIGRPISNTLVYLLDQHQQLVPIGVPGELYIGGDGLACGYRNRPELTSQRFLESPFPGCATLYRSGDLATYLPDGTIRFLGRADQQVKVRGHRIELGEIEAAIAAIHGVTANVVTVHSTSDRGDLIVARFTAERPIPLHEVRSSLKLRLPAYMVPNLFEQRDAFPSLASGKIDRSTLTSLPLPPPVQEEIKPRYLEDDAPLLIAEAMAELLQVQEVSVTDDFFSLGGHSMLAVQLAARLEELFGKAVPVALLFQASTPRTLAEYFKEHTGVLARHIVPLQPHGDRPPMFCTHLSDGKIHYYLSLVRSLSRDQPVYGICLPELGVLGHRRSLSLQDLAEFHLQELRRVRSKGPYVLCGYSAGGSLAYEIARRLLNEGELVRLIIIDGFAPPPLTERLRFLRIKVARRDLLDVAPHFLFRNGRRITKSLLRRIRSVITHAQTPAASDSRKMAALLEQAQKSYKPAIYKGKLLLVHAENDKLHTRLKVQDLHYWDRYVSGEITTIRQVGNHWQILAPPLVAGTAAMLQQALADWDGAADRPRTVGELPTPERFLPKPPARLTVGLADFFENYLQLRINREPGVRPAQSPDPLDP
jgi:aspartate racemase